MWHDPCRPRDMLSEINYTAAVHRRTVAAHHPDMSSGHDSWLTDRHLGAAWRTYACTSSGHVYLHIQLAKIPDDDDLEVDWTGVQHSLDRSTQSFRFSFLSCAICVFVLPVLAFPLSQQASIYSPSTPTHCSTQTHTLRSVISLITVAAH
jgi:hypothetical protein